MGMNETIAELRRLLAELQNGKEIPPHIAGACVMAVPKLLDRLEQLEARCDRWIHDYTAQHVKLEQYEKALRFYEGEGLADKELHYRADGTVYTYWDNRMLFDQGKTAREALAQADSAKEEKGE